jgi:enoyl-CoA hydratase/carnithine racemase
MNMLLQSFQGSVCVLTLDRPHAGHSLSLELAQALRSALMQVRDRKDLRCIVITGSGDKFFCTGGDVKKYSELDDRAALAEVFDQVAELMDVIEQFPLPVVAAINGYAIGGGLELALACDLRFAAKHAQLGFPQARLGVIPGWNGTERLLRNVGKGQALRLLWSGKRVHAQEALDIGLVDGVCQQGTALDMALAFAADLDQCAPQSIVSVKQIVAATLTQERPVARAFIRDEFARLWFTPDHKEAEQAFAEKRPPRFTG